MFRLRSARMSCVSPRSRRPAASAECARPVSKASSGTSQECSQSAVKLAAGLEQGRAGPTGQCTSTPSVKLGAACVSAKTQTDLTVERSQPVVNFLDTAECPFVDDIPNCFPLGVTWSSLGHPGCPLLLKESGYRCCLIQVQK